MDNLHKQVSKMIMDQRDVLLQNATDRQYALQVELWCPYKQAGYTKSIRDAGYHFSYLAESLAANDPSLFLDYTAWAKVLFAGLHLPLGALNTALECMKRAMQETLLPDMAALAQGYVDAALAHLSYSSETLESFISPALPFYTLSSDYLEALLRGNRHLASQLILDAAAHNAGVKDIYLHVFQPCLLEIGRLWQMNMISVAQEHFCTDVTQMVMSQLYPYIFAAERTGHRLVATAVGGELHEIGMRMVADFLELNGWDTYYLGANMPTESILRAIEERQADVLAISATLSLHISKMEELINCIRSSSVLPTIKILVGGYPFNIARGLWQQVGADGYASNALETVSAANRLMERPL